MVGVSMVQWVVWADGSGGTWVGAVIACGCSLRGHPVILRWYFCLVRYYTCPAMA